MEKVLVKNVADEGQVKQAREKEKSLRDRELNDVRTVLSTPEGKRLLWRMLSHCKVFNSIHENSARIHYNSGMQDVGHFIMGEIIEANPDSFIEMMKANRGDKQ